MATVKIDRFGGIAPRQHPTLLTDGMAVTAHNVRLKTGKLVPLKEPKLATGMGVMLEGGLESIENAKSIHAWKRTDGSVDFLLFGGTTWLAEGNIADDERTRVIVSGETGADWTDTGNTTHEDVPVIYMRDGGVKKIHHILKDPLPVLHVTRTGSTLDDNRRYTRFFATWVDEYGYESPVNAPSKIGIVYATADGWSISVNTEAHTATATKNTQSVTVPYYGTSTTPDSITEWVDGDLEYLDGDNVSFVWGEAVSDAIKAAATKVRLYKVVTGTDEGRIQFVWEYTANAQLWSNGSGAKIKDEDTGEVLPEIESPPADLYCVQDVPGAFYCGLSRGQSKTVLFSDINLPYSWPVAYRYNVKDNVVALAVTSNTVFALTDGWPYVLTGTAPESMTVAKLAGPAACVSPRGVCVYKNAVYYVSNAGLMTIYNSANAGTVCENLTDKIFTKEQWLAMNPASCVMGQFDGALILFFTLSNGERKALSIDLLEQAAVAVTTHDEMAACLCTDNKTDKLYFVRG